MNLTKRSPAAQAAYDAELAKLTLTADEANEVGRAAALAAENGRHDSWHRPMREAAEPTRDEADELASATEQLEAAQAVTSNARMLAIEAEAEYNRRVREGYEYEGAGDRARHDLELARLKLEGNRTIDALDLAQTLENQIDMRVRRARVAILNGGAARQAAFLMRQQR